MLLEEFESIHRQLHDIFTEWLIALHLQHKLNTFAVIFVCLHSFVTSN